MVSFWALYLYRGNRNGPPVIRRLSSFFALRMTAWQQLVLTALALYLSRNFGKLVGLECPEPLANLYTRSYFRATWVTTALDAGFWSAMRIRRKWARDLLSMVFSVYYLFATEQADEKVRKIRSTLTVEHLRVSWNKSTTPYLSTLTGLLRPRLMRYPPRAIRIPRPKESDYTDPVNAWLYFDGPISALRKHDTVLLDIPGGGFVAMTPRNHEDKLLAWAGRTGRPVLSLDYRKAPEYPYPYALNECYDVYHTLHASRGRCIGMSGEQRPRVVLSGDSAGGNFATGVVLKILQAADQRGASRRPTLPVPEGLVLIYPGLDMNIGNWMTDEQMSLIKDRRTRTRNKNILRRKSEIFSKLAPNTPHQSDDDDDIPSALAPLSTSTKAIAAISQAAVDLDDESPLPNPPAAHLITPAPAGPAPGTVLKTRLAISSMISYTLDRILTPEMMRAMIILYVGPTARPDFSTDYLLSPLLAPDHLLARFPKTYFLTGERDPLVDDTVIFAGRIRRAKFGAWVARKEQGIERRGGHFKEGDHVEVQLVDGVSHGFLQFLSLWPEGWQYIYKVTDWVEEAFTSQENKRRQEVGAGPPPPPQQQHAIRHHRRIGTGTESSGDEGGMEMSMGMSKVSERKEDARAGDAARVSNGFGNRRRGEGPRKTGRIPTRIKSSVSLASEDDFLGRRMKGLAGGLMGGLDEG